MSESNKIKVKEITKEEMIIEFVNHICNNEEYKNAFCESYEKYKNEPIRKDRYDNGISYLKEFIRYNLNKNYEKFEVILDNLIDIYINEHRKESLKEDLKDTILTLLDHISYMYGDIICVIFIKYIISYPNNIKKDFEIKNFVNYICNYKEYLIKEVFKEMSLQQLQRESPQIRLPKLLQREPPQRRIIPNSLQQLQRVSPQQIKLPKSLQREPPQRRIIPKSLQEFQSEPPQQNSNKILPILPSSKRSQVGKGGNPPKYKSTGITVRILYKKRKYKRIIYVKDTNKTKYCKIDGEYILLSKMKVI
jgi:hypothetical protein